VKGRGRGEGSNSGILVLGGGHGGVVNKRRKNGGGDVRAREGIGDNVIFARYVADISCKLGNVGKLALLTCRPGRGNAMHGGGEGLMIGVKLKRSSFQEETEVANGEVGGEEFTIKCGVLLLGRSEFGGEKGKGFPTRRSRLLEYSACLGVRGICGNGDGGGGIREL
jgi:hypothetical protein